MPFGQFRQSCFPSGRAYSRNRTRALKTGFRAPLHAGCGSSSVRLGLGAALPELAIAAVSRSRGHTGAAFLVLRPASAGRRLDRSSPGGPRATMAAPLEMDARVCRSKPRQFPRKV